MLKNIEDHARRLGYHIVNYKNKLLHLQADGLLILIREINQQQQYYVVLIRGKEVLSLNMQHRKLLLLLEALSPERHTNKLSFQLKN